jgi:cobalamin biosynthesis protein CobT
MLIAALTVEIFARVLERCGVRCEVLGFTTREWDGGEPARQWAADGYPENPGTPERARAHRDQERRRAVAPGAPGARGSSSTKRS